MQPPPTPIQPDGGLYECSASNDVGQLRHAAWLNVTGPAHIRPMSSVSAIAGGSLTIMCPAGGWPIEQIGWFQSEFETGTFAAWKVASD